MLKRPFFLILLMVCLASASLASSKQDTIPPFIGVTYVPSLKWNIHFIQDENGNFLDYNFKNTTLSSYEGSFGIRRIGMRVGLSAQVDNNLIGKIHRYGGYLGLKGYWLRLQGSSIEGSVNWTGTLPPGFASYHEFNNSYYTVELLKSFTKKRYIDGKWETIHAENQMGFYWGIGYTSFKLPVKLSTLVTPGGRENQQFAVPIFDTLFAAKYYTIGAGFDLLRQLSMTGGRYSMVPGQPAKRFSMYAATEDKIGFGPGKLSEHAQTMGEALNPGKTMVNRNFFSTSINYYLSVGFRYYVRAKPVFLIFAAGYDLEGTAIINFGGAADTNTDLGFDANFFYFNHGVSFKFYVSWIGR